MKTITLEEHFVTRDFLRVAGGYGGAATSGPYSELIPRLLDLGAGRIAAMDDASIDVQVMSAAAMGFEDLDASTATALAASVNDELADAITAHPDRLRGLAMLGVKDPARAAAELERCVTMYGFLGAMVNGTSDGLFLDQPRFRPVFEAAAQLKVPIYLHPAPPPKAVESVYFAGLPGEVGHLLSIAGWGWHAETGLHTLRLICSGLFDQVPGLQVIIGHMGEGLPYAMARSSGILSKAANLPKPLADYFQSNITITTSGYFSLPPLKCALEVVGIDHVLFSVDYPFSANTRGRTFLDEAATVLSDEEMQKLTHKNAERVLKF